MRDYFSENVLYWAHHFHIDGLRLDATHEIFDRGAVSIWELIQQRLAENPPQIGNRFCLIAESDLNSPRVIQSVDQGGYGFDAQWLDDFHHTLYVLLDENGKERYADFGRIRQLQKAYEDGFVHSGEFVNFRIRRHGKSSTGIPGKRFVVFNQNHDQIGNRVMGERLSQLVDFDRLKLAAGALMMSPYIPMLFMGEEYGDDTPFFYFVSHSDPDLSAAVSEGRKELLSEFSKGEESYSDPSALSTFQKSKCDWDKRSQGKYKILRDWNKRLVHFRKTHPALRSCKKEHLWAHPVGPSALALCRESHDGDHLLLILMNFAEQTVDYPLPDTHSWNTLLDSTDNQWQADSSDEPTPPAEPIEGVVRIKPLQFAILERVLPEDVDFSTPLKE